MGERTSIREIAVKAIVYDLPSENLRNIANEDIKDMIRSTRVYSVQLLHSIGAQCTESVVLVPYDNVSKIETIVRRVRDMYNSLKEELRRHGFELRANPIIEILNLTSEQVEQLIPLAKRRLLEQLDKAIDKVSRAIERLEIEEDEERIRRTIRNLKRIYRDWERVQRVARALGIDISRDYEYLVSLIDEGLRRA